MRQNSSLSNSLEGFIDFKSRSSLGQYFTRSDLCFIFQKGFKYLLENMYRIKVLPYVRIYIFFV